MSEEKLLCDFCSHPSPTRNFVCPSFPMDRAPGFPELRSTGDWLACSVCGGMIDADNWNGLLLRAVASLEEKYRGVIPRRILTDTVKRSHDLFRQHYRREKVDLTQKHKEALRDPKAEVAIYELTPERKEHLLKVCDEVIDLLTKRTSGPMEAMVALHMVNSSLEEVYGTNVTGSFTIPVNEPKH